MRRLSYDAYGSPAKPGSCPETRTNLSPTPFAGLGFDLSAVAARAQAMAWLPVRSLKVPASRGSRNAQFRDFPILAGFELLLHLSREIRGR